MCKLPKDSKHIANAVNSSRLLNGRAPFSTCALVT